MPKVTMYSAPWCGDCHNAKRAFRNTGIEFDEIDIDQNEDAAKQVIEWSGGRRVIPTIHVQQDDLSENIIVHNPRGHDLDALISRILTHSKH